MRSRVIGAYALCVACIMLVATSSSLAVVADGGNYVQLSPNYNFVLYAYGTYVFWNDVLYANYVSGFSNQVDFLNASLGSPSNAAQTFGLSVENANLTIMAISKNSVNLAVSALSTGKGGNAILFYYYPGNETFPVEVSLGGKTNLNNESYYTSTAQFDSAGPPSALINQTGGYLEIRVDAPTILTIYTLPLSHSTTETSSSTSAGSSMTSEISKNNNHPTNNTPLILASVVTVGVLAISSFFNLRMTKKKSNN